jgi:hypothetical protein
MSHPYPTGAYFQVSHPYPQRSICLSMEVLLRRKVHGPCDLS